MARQQWWPGAPCLLPSTHESNISPPPRAALPASFHLDSIFTHELSPSPPPNALPVWGLARSGHHHEEWDGAGGSPWWLRQIRGSPVLALDPDGRTSPRPRRAALRHPQGAGCRGTAGGEGGPDGGGSCARQRGWGGGAGAGQWWGGHREGSEREGSGALARDFLGI